MLMQFPITFLFVILTFVVMIIIKKKFTYKYFSLKDIIDPAAKDISVKGALLIFVPPFIISFILSAVIKENTLNYISIYF